MSDASGLLATKLRGAVLQTQHLPRAFRLVWSAARGWTAIWITLLAVQGAADSIVTSL
jgi:hypothetical protein